MYTCNVYIVCHFYFPEAFLQVKKLMEKSYSETEQNMSEKQGKSQIMQPMNFENHAMNRENELIKKLKWLNTSQIQSYMAFFQTNPKTNQKLFRVPYKVSLKKFTMKMSVKMKLYQRLLQCQKHDYNSNIENIVEEVYTAVNM